MREKRMEEDKSISCSFCPPPTPLWSRLVRWCFEPSQLLGAELVKRLKWTHYEGLLLKDCHWQTDAQIEEHWTPFIENRSASSHFLGQLFWQDRGSHLDGLHLLGYVSSQAVFSRDLPHAREVVQSLERLQLCHAIRWHKTVIPYQVPEITKQRKAQTSMTM